MGYKALHIPADCIVHCVIDACAWDQWKCRYYKVRCGGAFSQSGHYFCVYRGGGGSKEICQNIVSGELEYKGINDPGEHTAQGAKKTAPAVDIKKE